MASNTFSTLVNSQSGNLEFKIYSFADANHFDHVQRFNYYTLIMLTKGFAKLKADFSDYHVEEGMLLCFSPYQPFMLKDVRDIEGIVINFHPDFFCIHKHHNEIACNGVLFNNVYEAPYLTVTDNEKQELSALIEKMKNEIQDPTLAQNEALISYLKLFLIKASRIKNQQTKRVPDTATGTKPYIIQNLKDAIEKHYKSKHSASDYADLLNISYSALAKMSKSYFNKTLTELISERIVIEAKRELYLTSKPVKNIAYNLGFDDEYYFSRFFKKNADVSPQQYRDTVGFARQEA